MVEHRGRPKENIEPLTGKYKRIYENEDGTINTWYYDTDRTTRGPVKVEITYPKDYDFRTEDDILNEDNENLPKTRRKYINPKNGKLVGYTRARALGII